MAVAEAELPVRPVIARGRRPLGGISPFQLAVVIATSALVGVSVAAGSDWKISVALLAGGALSAIGFLRPVLFIGVFLITRPVTESISNDQLVHGVASANAAGATALLIIAVFVIALVTGPKLRFPRASATFALVIALSAMTAVYALATVHGIGTEPISELIRLAALLAIYILAANWFAGIEKTRLVFAIVALSAILPAIIGLVQWIHGAPYVAELGLRRITSTMGGGPNNFSAYLALAALVLVGAGNILPARVRWPALVLILVTLVGTYSREGWAMFLIGVVLLGWRRQRLLVVTIAVVATTLTFAVPTIHNRVLPTSNITKFAAGSSTYASFSWRLQNWRHLLDKVDQSPVIGYGLRSTVYVNPLRVAGGAGPADGYAAHNLVIRVLVEGGVVLLIAYIALMAAILGIAARMAREHWPLQDLGRVVLVLWITIVIIGLVTDDPFANTTMMYALLALTGSLEGARRVLRTEATAATNRFWFDGELDKPA